MNKNTTQKNRSLSRLLSLSVAVAGVLPVHQVQATVPPISLPKMPVINAPTLPGLSGLGTSGAQAQRFLASGIHLDLQKAMRDLALHPQFAQFSRSAIQNLVPSEGTGAIVESEDLATARFEHLYKGLPVIGSQALYHQDGANAWIESALAQFDLSTEPTLASDDAVSVVRAQLGQFEPSATPSLAILPIRVEESEVQDSARLIYQLRGFGRLSTKLDAQLEPLVATVDAHTGEVLSTISTHLQIAPISVYSAKGLGIDADEKELQIKYKGDVEAYLAAHADQCQIMVDYSTPKLKEKDPLVINYSNCAKQIGAGVAANVVADASAKQAASNTKLVLNYYQTTHGRNSFDNKGGEVVSVVHAGVNFANAFWDTEIGAMAYGDGDGVEMGDLTKVVDISGHEMTHGVVSQTAKLVEGSEAGALNEAIADYFGKQIEGKGTWMMGAGVFLDGTAGIRDLKNPASLSYENLQGAKKPYPDNYKKKELGGGNTCNGTNDDCWVHINSTIFSHGMYLVHTAIGGDKAQKLMYATLTQFLTPTSTLKTAGASLRKACAKVLDAASCKTVNTQLTSVGI